MDANKIVKFHLSFIEIVDLLKIEVLLQKKAIIKGMVKMLFIQSTWKIIFISFIKGT